MHNINSYSHIRKTWMKNKVMDFCLLLMQLSNDTAYFNSRTANLKTSQANKRKKQKKARIYAFQAKIFFCLTKFYRT